MSAVKRYYCCDHTAGAYWDPHDPLHCKKCGHQPTDEDHVLASDYDAALARLRIAVEALNNLGDLSEETINYRDGQKWLLRKFRADAIAALAAIGEVP